MSKNLAEVPRDPVCLHCPSIPRHMVPLMISHLRENSPSSSVIFAHCQTLAKHDALGAVTPPQICKSKTKKQVRLQRAFLKIEVSFLIYSRRYSDQWE